MDGVRRTYNDAVFSLLIHSNWRLSSNFVAREIKNLFTVLGEQKIIRPNFIYYNDIIIIFIRGILWENNTRLKDDRIFVSTRPCRFEVGSDDRTTT